VPVTAPGRGVVTGGVEAADLDAARGALLATAAEPGRIAAAVDPIARIVMTRNA
jgi:hypothetical protein